MLVTTLSTFFGFLACGAAPIPSVSAFGIFGALVVVFDYVMVISFFASAIVVYERYLRNSPRYVAPHFLRPVGCCGVSELPQILGAALQGLLARCLCFNSGTELDDGLRAPERFFKYRVAPMVFKFRWPIVIFWAVLGTAFLICTAVLFRPATEAPTFFADKYGKRMNQLLMDGFLQSSSELRVPIRIVMGIYQDPQYSFQGAHRQGRHQLRRSRGSGNASLRFPVNHGTEDIRWPARSLEPLRGGPRRLRPRLEDCELHDQHRQGRPRGGGRLHDRCGLFHRLGQGLSDVLRRRHGARLARKGRLADNSQWASLFSWSTGSRRLPR